MDKIFDYIGLSFKMEVKKLFAYKSSFWIVFWTIPLWSLVQILFIETIYRQTGNFAGYNRFESYILFGTYNITNNLAYFLFYYRLKQLAELIRGNDHESLDEILTKPIDTQLYTTIGRFNFGHISSIIVGLFLIFYGLINNHTVIQFSNVIGYLILVILGIFVVYVTFFFLRTLIFWFEEFLVTEGLWDAYSDLGKYPSALYQGPIGLIVNLVIPITLMGSIPVDLLLGRIPGYTVVLYIFVIALLFVVTRWFWKISLKNYSSFSS